VYSSTCLSGPFISPWCCGIWSTWIVRCFIHLFVLAEFEFIFLFLCRASRVSSIVTSLHPCVHNMIHQLFLLRSLIPVFSCPCFLLLVAVKAWGGCWYHKGLWWTWYSCTNWSFRWRYKVHGDPRWTWSCHPRKEGHWGHYYQENRHVLDYWCLRRANDSRAMQHGGGEARRLPDRAGLLKVRHVLFWSFGHQSLRLIWFCNPWARACTWRIACSE